MADFPRFYGVPLSRVRGVVTLREFAAMAAYLPEESATFRVIHPEESAWGLREQLLAEAVDTLHWLQWAKTKDGAKNTNRPRPVPRPGVDDGSETEVKHFGEPVPLDELLDFLGWGSVA